MFMTQSVSLKPADAQRWRRTLSLSEAVSKQMEEMLLKGVVMRAKAMQAQWDLWERTIRQYRLNPDKNYEICVAAGKAPVIRESQRQPIGKDATTLAGLGETAAEMVAGGGRTTSRTTGGGRVRAKKR